MSPEAEGARPVRELDATYPEDAPIPCTLTAKAEAFLAALQPGPPTVPEPEARL